MPTYSENCPVGRVRHLGVLLRAHHRHQYLSRVIGDIFTGLGRGRKITFTIGVDRPTPEVLGALAKHIDLCRQHKSRFLNVHSIPKVVTSAGANWMEPLIYLHERHREDIEASGWGPVQAGMLLDDDALFSREGLREIRGHLEDLAYDRLDVEHKFLWDHQDQYNAAVPCHRSCAVWRQYENDDFPHDFIVKCPQRVARSLSVCRLETTALEYGWLTAEDREAAFHTAKLAGRLDAHTLALVRPPNLKRLDGSHTK